MAESIVYVTCETLAEAEEIGMTIVSRRLVACVNIVENMKSIYWWKNEIVKACEVILLAKTCSSLVPELIEVIKQNHTYEVPCIVSLPILDGNPEFLEWIRTEVGSGAIVDAK